jgi:uncharacterized protein
MVKRSAQDTKQGLSVDLCIPNMNIHTVNNIEFAKQGGRLQGTLSLAECPRLLGTVLQDANSFSLNYQLSGGMDSLNRPVIQLSIAVSLPLACQRCLDPMTHDLNLQYHYIISANADEEDEDDQHDWVLPDRAMNLLMLIEDEILAAMPIAPSHDECIEIKPESIDKQNPFAVLKKLRSSQN